MGKQVDLIVEGGRVVTGGSVVEADVAIGGEKIVALTAPGNPPLEAGRARRIDASGKLVLPGVVDAHVHMRNFNLRQTHSPRLARPPPLVG